MHARTTRIRRGRLRHDRCRPRKSREKKGLGPGAAAANHQSIAPLLKRTSSRSTGMLMADAGIARFPIAARRTPQNSVARHRVYAAMSRNTCRCPARHPAACDDTTSFRIQPRRDPFSRALHVAECKKTGRSITAPSSIVHLHTCCCRTPKFSSKARRAHNHNDLRVISTSAADPSHTRQPQRLVR